jgi:hypothetical protein
MKIGVIGAGAALVMITAGINEKPVTAVARIEGG